MPNEAVPARAPAIEAEPGWTPLDPPRLEGGRGSFVSGEPEGERLRVRYFRRDADSALVGRAWFGPGTVGPPGHAHGGAIAAVLDEATGGAVWMAGARAVAVRLETDFRRLLPIGTDAYLEASVVRTEGRKMWARAVLSDASGEPFAEAEVLFLELDRERFGDILARAEAAIAARGGRRG